MARKMDYTRKQKIVLTFLGTVCHDQTPEIEKLLAYCYGRVLAKRPGEGNPVQPEDHVSARHVRDWLVAAVANCAPWLKNVDHLGRPKKLMKFPTVEALVREVDMWMLREASKNRDIRLVGEDEAFELEVGDGYYVVRLLTPTALDRESGRMQHCVGGGAYDRDVVGGRIFIFSLRDASGKPHATIEEKEGRIVQIQGKQNEPPIRTYLERLSPFLRERQHVIAEHALSGRYLYVDDYEVRDSWDLRDVREVRGDLKWDGAELKLPRTLLVHGDIRLSRCKFPDGFPRDLRCVGDIRITRCNGIELPSAIEAGGSVEICWSDIRGEIDVLRAGGGVSFARSTIGSLPRSMSFNGSLRLTGTEITDLGSLKEVNGSLDIEQTEIPSLPDGLVIRRDLIAGGSGLAAYPANVSIHGHVDISNTAVADLPPVKVNGMLDIGYTRIRAIPAGLDVDRLSAGGLDIDSFSPDVRISDVTSLRTTRLRLPSGLNVEGVLNLEGARAHRLPDDLTAGEIRAAGAELSRIGKNLRVQGKLDLCSTSIGSLPDDMKVGGPILARQTFVRSLSEGFSTADDLDLTGSEIAALPGGMNIGGSLVLHQTEVAVIPADLVVAGKLVITHTDVSHVPSTAAIGDAVVSDDPAVDTRSYGQVMVDELKKHLSQPGRGSGL